MATLVIYDIVKRHLPQDYVGPDPISVLSTFQNLMKWMEAHDCLRPAGMSKFENQKPTLVVQLDSSMFNDTGNTLMRDCYDRWVSGLDFDHLIQTCDVPLDMGQTNFNGFEAKYKQLQGDPMYCNSQPNIGDTYKDTMVIEKPNLELEENKFNKGFSFFKLLNEGESAFREQGSTQSAFRDQGSTQTAFRDRGPTKPGLFDPDDPSTYGPNRPAFEANPNKSSIYDDTSISNKSTYSPSDPKPLGKSDFSNSFDNPEPLKPSEISTSELPSDNSSDGPSSSELSDSSTYEDIIKYVQNHPGESIAGLTGVALIGFLVKKLYDRRKAKTEVTNENIDFFRMLNN